MIAVCRNCSMLVSFLQTKYFPGLQILAMKILSHQDQTCEQHMFFLQQCCIVTTVSINLLCEALQDLWDNIYMVVHLRTGTNQLKQSAVLNC